MYPKGSFADILEAVQSFQVDYGVLPFENSTNGSVVQALNLLADRQSKYSSVRVCGEKYLTVHHCLLAAKGTEIDQIRLLYTHPQAWDQCEGFLSKHFKGVERRDVSSTSKAAEIVASDGTRSSAAIASRLAGEHHGCEILSENIEDQANNTTRFFILQNADRRDQAVSIESGNPGREDDPKRWKTLLSFTIDHAAPGALADALNVFKLHNLNLTSIYTRPSQMSPWHYIFFVECAETRNDEDMGSVNVALDEMKKATTGCQHLGTWQDELP